MTHTRHSPRTRQVRTDRPLRWHARASAVALLCALGAAPAGADIRTWDGGSPTVNWSDGGNWNGNTAIANHSTLVFAGTKRLINTNDLPNLSVDGLSFAAGAGAFTLGGNGIYSHGNLDNLSTFRQTLNLQIDFMTDQTWNGGNAGIQMNAGLGWVNSNVLLAQQVFVKSLTHVHHIGNSGTGALTLRGGSVVESGGATYLGWLAGSFGTLSVDGLGSRWVTGSAMAVGISGGGTLNVLNGGQVSSTLSTLGYVAGSSGTASVVGQGSQWQAGTMNIGFHASSGTLANSSGGTLDILNGGVVTADNATLGRYTGATGTVTVDGLDSLWQISGDLDVGYAGNGTLKVLNRSTVSSANGTLGSQSGGRGTATVEGAGSLWLNSGHLAVGNLGQGTLDILNGGSVVAKSLGIGAGSVVNLAGGRLQLDNVKLPGPGRFNWTSGTLKVLNDASLDGARALTTGMALEVGQVLTVGAGQALVLAGGQLRTGALVLKGGSLMSLGSLDIATTGNVTGHGLLAGGVVGGAFNSISASGGTLTLGHASLLGGYDFAGTLNTGGQQVVLLSADAAQLGVSTTLDAGGRLSAINGARLGVGETLSFTGNARIDGNFHHDGAISGSAGTLTFTDDVSGAGSFAGNILFQGAYNPGNSPATVHFNNTQARFDTTSVLRLEIQGTNAGTQYDQLVDIDTLNFDGHLSLAFAGGFEPTAGTRLQLFNFNHFSGHLGADNISVTGFDARRLDFNRLSLDGSLGVTAAVPEPGTWALFSAGLLGLCWLARRRAGAFHAA